MRPAVAKGRGYGGRVVPGGVRLYCLPAAAAQWRARVSTPVQLPPTQLISTPARCNRWTRRITGPHERHGPAAPFGYERRVDPHEPN